MFEYHKNGIDVRLKEEFMDDLVKFVSLSHKDNILVPEWLDDAAISYVKKDLEALINDGAYDWFEYSVNISEANIILENVAKKYITHNYLKEYSDFPKEKLLDTLLSDEHLEFITLRENEQEDREL